jgi:hypothetical protein
VVFVYQSTLLYRFEALRRMIYCGHRSIMDGRLKHCIANLMEFLSKDHLRTNEGSPVKQRYAKFYMGFNPEQTKDKCVHM